MPETEIVSNDNFRFLSRWAFQGKIDETAQEFGMRVSHMDLAETNRRFWTHAIIQGGSKGFGFLEEVMGQPLMTSLAQWDWKFLKMFRKTTRVTVQIVGVSKVNEVKCAMLFTKVY